MFRGLGLELGFVCQRLHSRHDVSGGTLMSPARAPTAGIGRRFVLPTSIRTTCADRPENRIISGGASAGFGVDSFADSSGLVQRPNRLLHGWNHGTRSFRSRHAVVGHARTAPYGRRHERCCLSADLDSTGGETGISLNLAGFARWLGATGRPCRSAARSKRSCLARPN